MEQERIVQGRRVTECDIDTIRNLIANNPEWHRTRISRELCELWGWRNDAGAIKDMAARSLLRKLAEMGLIELPAPIRSSNNQRKFRNTGEKPTYEPIEAKLSELQPIRVVEVEDDEQAKVFRSLVAHYHYLGYQGPVGENLRYLAYDCHNRILGCLLFGASAWKVASRDRWIGWDDTHRREGLSHVANNMRFLILPEVRVAHLASHLLGKVSRQISTDWSKKYGHPIELLETFVENQRFAGTCYKAANWKKVGETTGRSRNDRRNTLKVPVKSVWLYQLGSNRVSCCQGALS
jgi:hypothetical protein